MVNEGVIPSAYSDHAMTLCTHLLLVSGLRMTITISPQECQSLCWLLVAMLYLFLSYSLPHNKIYNIHVFVHFQVCENSKVPKACTLCTLHRQWTYIKVLLDRLLAAQLVKLPVLDWTQRFITIIKLAHNWANICTKFSPYPTSDMTHAYHTTSFIYSIHVSIAQIMKLITQFSPVSCIFCFFDANIFIITFQIKSVISLSLDQQRFLLLWF